MADDIIKDLNPNIGVYNNLDPLNTKSVAVKDFNSDAMLAAVQTMVGKAGKTQIFQKVVQQAANLGAYTLATITTQACLIKSITVKAVTAAQADLTSAAITGGAGGVISFLSAVDTAVANIDAIDEQVWWQGTVELGATKTIVMTLVGTGATPVDLLVTFEYMACADGGYLA